MNRLHRCANRFRGERVGHLAPMRFEPLEARLFMTAATGMESDGPAPLPLDGGPIRFAIVGDIGSNAAREVRVRDMVNAWNVDYIILPGDANEIGFAPPLGSENWTLRVGNHYGQYIKATTDGRYPELTSPVQRFFPSVGNHDVETEGGSIAGYLDYFHTDPAGGRLPTGGGMHEPFNSYYDFVLGPIHFFALDSEHAKESDASLAAQRAYLQQGLAASTATWKIVYFHHSPNNSVSLAGGTMDLRWPFREWGADLVIASHAEVYERLMVDGLLNIVQGLGGVKPEDFELLHRDSQSRYNANNGAMLMIVDEDSLRFEQHTVTSGGRLVDQFTLHRQPVAQLPLVTLSTDWNYLAPAAAPPADWAQPTFDDSLWSAGPAPIGRGLGDEATPLPAPIGNAAPAYFRTTFNLDDPSDYLSFDLDLVRDDGAVVYLNGLEVARFNMPSAAVTHATLAAEPVELFEQTSGYRAVLEPSAFLPGLNTLAVRVHPASVADLDLRFNLSLTGVKAAADAPPAVTGVRIGSAAWPTAFLTSLQNADQGRRAYAMPTGDGDQLAALPWDDLNQITLDFSEPVLLSGGDLILQNLSSGPVAQASFTRAADGKSATWRFTSPLAAGTYEIRLAESVADSGGDLLDGEWQNPVSFGSTTGDSLPSGDGLDGGDFIFRFRVLPGDVTGDGLLSGADIDTLRASIGRFDPRSDLNTTAAINTADLDELILTRLGTRYGDLNLDRNVSIGDLVVLAENFQQTPPRTWAQGELNGDGQVTIGDLVLLAENYGFNANLIGEAAQPPAALLVAAEPDEPAPPPLKPLAPPVAPLIDLLDLALKKKTGRLRPHGALKSPLKP